MAKGSISKAEHERLVSKMMSKQYVGAAFSGLREDMSLAERVEHARKRSFQRQLAMGCLTGDEPEVAYFAAGRAARALAASGRKAEQLTLSLICPQEMTEAELRDWTRSWQKSDVTFAQVELRREEVPHVIAQVVATGALCEGPELCGQKESASRSQVDEGMSAEQFHIILCGATGEEGTVLLYHRHRELLERRYPKHFLEEIPGYAEGAWRATAVEDGWLHGAEYQWVCGDGGVYAGLWELGEKLRCGMVVDVPSIPIRQQTIEVCEVLDRNPYQLAAGNCVLMVTRAPEHLLKALWQKGYEAEDIGYLQTAAARELRNGDEVRYVEPYRGGDGMEA